MELRSISLFSGAMGLDLGLMQAGIDIQIGQDFDNSCIRTMCANGYKGVAGDIRNISAASILEQVNMKTGEPFLICGGPPCQPFSTAGKRLGINDPRGSLFKEFMRMIDEIRPRFFVMENVKGLMSSALKDENGNNTGTKVLDVILNEFCKLNYKTVFGVLDAVNYGVPQFRERFVMIGSRDNEDIFLPAPTHFRIHQNPKYRWVTLGDAIKDLEFADGECAAFSDSRLQYLKMVPEGGNWKSLPHDIFAGCNGWCLFLRRRKSWILSPLILFTAESYGGYKSRSKATMMCHPTQDRPLSVAEYARIQQFPDDWRFIGTTVDKYRQIGNAVPVGLARAIGETLVAVAKGEQEIVVKRIRGTGIHDRIQNAIRVGGTDKC